jgi:hypothetical protein
MVGLATGLLQRLAEAARAIAADRQSQQLGNGLPLTLKRQQYWTRCSSKVQQLHRPVVTPTDQQRPLASINDRQ